MDTDKLNFIEESGLVLEKLGMTRMAGRVFGYLMICDEDQVSFDDIRKALDASKGSISATTKQLVYSKLVEQVSIPGDRKTYFRISRKKAGGMLKERLKLFTMFSELLSKGLSIKQKDDEVSDWLLEVSTFYSWVGDEFDQIINKWEAHKAEIIENMRGEK
jgi:DNA-binding transcriptional regulator GbsR (MarR family)